MDLDTFVHIPQFHRKIIGIHLNLQDLLQRLVAPRRSINVNGALSPVGREEKREPLDMVPMGVTDKEVDGERLRGKLADQTVAEPTDPRAGVKHQNVVVASHLDTGGISAVAHRRSARRGNRTAGAPEPDVHHGPTFRFCICSRTICMSSSSSIGLTMYESAPSSRALSISGL